MNTKQRPSCARWLIVAAAWAILVTCTIRPSRAQAEPPTLDALLKGTPLILSTDDDSAARRFDCRIDVTPGLSIIVQCDGDDSALAFFSGDVLYAYARQGLILLLNPNIGGWDVFKGGTFSLLFGHTDDQDELFRDLTADAAPPHLRLDLQSLISEADRPGSLVVLSNADGPWTGSAVLRNLATMTFALADASEDPFPLWSFHMVSPDSRNSITVNEIETGVEPGESILSISADELAAAGIPLHPLAAADISGARLVPPADLSTPRAAAASAALQQLFTSHPAAIQRMAARQLLRLSAWADVQHTPSVAPTTTSAPSTLRALPEHLPVGADLDPAVRAAALRRLLDPACLDSLARSAVWPASFRLDYSRSVAANRCATIFGSAAMATLDQRLRKTAADAQVDDASRAAALDLIGDIGSPDLDGAAVLVRSIAASDNPPLALLACTVLQRLGRPADDARQRIVAALHDPTTPLPVQLRGIEALAIADQIPDDPTVVRLVAQNVWLDESKRSAVNPRFILALGYHPSGRRLLLESWSAAQPPLPRDQVLQSLINGITPRESDWHTCLGTIESAALDPTSTPEMAAQSVDRIVLPFSTTARAHDIAAQLLGQPDGSRQLLGITIVDRRLGALDALDLIGAAGRSSRSDVRLAALGALIDEPRRATTAPQRTAISRIIQAALADPDAAVQSAGVTLRDRFKLVRLDATMPAP